MSGSGNLLSNLPADLAQEIFEDVASSGNVQIERIISGGHVTPEGEWYDQNWLEWVLILQGEAHLRIEGEAKARDLRPGHWVELPAHTRHRVDHTSSTPSCIWLAIHIGRPPQGAQ